MGTQGDIFAVQNRPVDDYDLGINEQYSDIKNVKAQIETKTSSTKTEPVYDIAVYKIRWLMLTVVVLLNISNGAIWISFATVANYTADYFQVSTAKVNWFSLIFLVTTIPLIFVALWITDRFGFKAIALTASALNALGSAIRLIATLPGIPDHARYPIALTGQGVCALSQPFEIVLITKTSEVWFPEEQRTISTALAAMSNPFGCMVASIVSPIIIQGKDDVPLANYILCGFGIVAGLFGFTVRHAKPPKPPSISAAKSMESRKVTTLTFIKDILYKIGKNKNFMILTLAIGGGIGMITTLESMMWQIICPMGYSNKVAGLCCGTMVVGGYIGAGIYSYFTKKRTRMEEVIKLGFTFAVVSAIVLTMVFRIRNVAWALALVCAVLGFLAMGIYPICLEAGVETIYPIDESFSAGMIVVSGQIQGAIFMPVMEALGQPLNNEEQHYETCSTGSSKEAYDMTYSSIFLTAYASLLNIIIILFFRVKYKRLATERENDSNNAQINLPSIK